MQISKEGLFRKAKITGLHNQKREDLDAIECFCKIFFCDLDKKMSNTYRDSKAKNIIEFNKQKTKSIKSVAIKFL